MNLSEIRQRREKKYMMPVAWDEDSLGFNKDAALQDIGDLLELLDGARAYVAREVRCCKWLPCDECERRVGNCDTHALYKKLDGGLE